MPWPAAGTVDPSPRVMHLRGDCRASGCNYVPRVSGDTLEGLLICTGKAGRTCSWRRGGLDCPGGHADCIEMSTNSLDQVADNAFLFWQPHSVVVT